MANKSYSRFLQKFSHNFGDGRDAAKAIEILWQSHNKNKFSASELPALKRTGITSAVNVRAGSSVSERNKQETALPPSAIPPPAKADGLSRQRRDDRRSPEAKLGFAAAARELSENVGFAEFVLDLGFDKGMVIAALLNNVYELGVEKTVIEKEFGLSLAVLLEDKMRFGKALSYKVAEKSFSIKKWLVAFSTEPRVVMLQLSEILQKLRNVRDCKDMAQSSFISEAKEIYAPLSHKLGMYFISSEMYDLTFKLEEPEKYTKTEDAIKSRIRKASESVERVKHQIESALKKASLEAKVIGRVKSVYSTYEKMRRKNTSVNGIFDLIAFRVITKDIKDCYEALGLFHSMWKPIISEFDDYIAKPKPNGYKSLHTSLYADEDVPLEIQIRTEEMDDFAEFGVASHWRYKGERRDIKYDKKIEWLKQIIEWEKNYGENTEKDIFGKDVFAMTPNGDVIELPDGSSVIDFAYAVHSDVGDKCVGAKINDKIASLNTVIKSGDIVEVLTSKKQKPKTSWLSFTKTGRARQKIMSRLNIPKFEERLKPMGRNSLAVKTSNLKIRFAKCCTPLPGDEIFGIKTTKRKISVHRSGCEQALGSGIKKIPVEWSQKLDKYDVRISALVEDRVGVLKDILGVFSRENVSVISTRAKMSHSSMGTCVFEVKLKNLKQLEEIFKKIKGVAGVTSVKRE